MDERPSGSGGVSRSHKPRRFGIADLMILIAALGVGIAGAWDVWLRVVDTHSGRTRAWLVFASIVSAVATPLTLACLAFRLRRPRPDRHRLWIQPGAAAILTCSLVFVLRTLELAVALAMPTRSVWPTTRIATIRVSDATYLLFMQGQDINGVVGYVEPLGCFGVTVVTFAWPCGSAVAAVWLMLAISGRWRPQRTWIDRLGRVLGWVWILITTLTAVPA
jgi:hypothetical protein